MLFRVVNALYLVLPHVLGLSFQAPESTLRRIGPSRPPPQGPQTTPQTHPRYHRRSELVTNTYEINPPNLCGWQGYDHNGEPVGCGTTTYTCAYHRSNKNYPAMLACCESGLNDCVFYSTCVDGSQISATPSFTDTKKPFSLYCTDDMTTACITWVYSDIDVIDFGCDTTSGTMMDIYADLFYTSSSIVNRHYVSLPQVGDDAVDSYSASFISEYGHNQASHTPSTTPTPTSTQTWTPTSDPGPDPDAKPDANSDFGSGSRSMGAIAGIVVGAGAGAALIGMAGFFLGKREKSKKENGDAGPGPGSNGNGGPYSSIPDVHSPSSVADTHDPPQQPAEMQGSTPADRVYEM